jgi:hypothetical protein
MLAPAAVCLAAPDVAAPATRPAEPMATLTAKATGPMLAGFPVQLQLTVTPSGPAPIYYWCGGPAKYPNADLFSVAVTDKTGATRTFPLHNGQYAQGSGITETVDPVQTLPAVFDPLPAGRYTLEVTGRSDGYLRDGKPVITWPAMEAAPFEMELTDDPAAVATAEAKLDRLARNDPFAKHVAETYGIATVVGQWMDKLLDDDPKIAFGVVGYLQHVLRLPADREADLPRAAEKHTKSAKPDINLLRYIAIIAGNLKTDSALDAALIIARADVAPDAVEAAVTALGEFPQKRAEQLLLDFAARPDYAGRWAALGALARRHNTAALSPLLGLTADPNPGRRMFAVSHLRGLRDQAAARDALNAALHDPDEAVRNAAKRALEMQDR